MPVSFRHPVTDGMSVSKGAPILNISAENMPDGDPVKRTRIAFAVHSRYVYVPVAP